ncbi:MAG TPA: 5-oxoprolinase subunit PxpA [Candidatus Accumulibacter phosphatis]|nr:MAG: LamB/YcsF family protein [Candidatus Accumulibacter sp. SK-11]HAY26672.1 LamB/YcsF family protein [Accumulibacter sp.]HRL74974.1 5-oxoprolinase subunit PxpA [Candidatus Accumulibacter phosphatis]HRQ93457.1 5-oxoprolinase subunit PxpA [Candidatus Accumulibacter phosphatis]
MGQAINLNADVGESFGVWQMGSDPELLQIVGTANIACGFHAGDPLLMRQTVRLALAAGASLGAHPSYPDLQGFGRRPMRLPPGELEALLIYQIGALAGIAQAEGGRLTHVKPHGALSNMACEDAVLAGSVVAAIRSFDPALIVLAPALSQLALAGEAAGLQVASEIFADRTYTDAGNLLPRSQAGSQLHAAAECVAHVRRMLDAGGVVSVGGKCIPTEVHSICVHGDGAQAVAVASAVRQALLACGMRLLPLPEVLAAADPARPATMV